jgi:segregation and condensation protein B
MENGFHNSIVEALILASPEPLPARKITEVVKDLTVSKVAQAVAELNNRYMAAGTAYRIRELAGGYQFYILPEFTPYVEDLFTRRRTVRLSRAALETLAIIAYRQPVTRVEIEQIRGVASDSVIHNLLEKGLITIKGRAKTVGKPLQYGTTKEFLKYFGLNRLEDLPRMSEIEELVAARQPQSQTELKLDNGSTMTKLNIADGTFDPSRVEAEEFIEPPATSDVHQDSAENDSNAMSSDSQEDSVALQTNHEETTEVVADRDAGGSTQ